VRNRLLTLVFATTLFALTLVGVVLVSIIYTAMDGATRNRAAATARVAASALEDLVEAGGHPTDETLRNYDTRGEAWLEATLPDGTRISSGPRPEGDTYRGIATAQDKPGSIVTVVAEIPVSVNLNQVRSQGLLVVLLSLFALGVSMLVALFYARRLTRPLEDFAQTADRLATGDRREVGRRYGISELDAVADVLDRGVSNFNELLENERRVTAEASHQLRTPLTALSLRLEEILAADDLDSVRTEATAALGQVERLSGVIDDVVSLSRGLALSPLAAYPLDRLVSSQMLEWEPAFEAEGRELRLVGQTRLVAYGAQGAQAQALATLLENSLVHGEGTTTVRVRGTGTWGVIEVGDDGPGVPPEVEPRVFERSVSGANSSGLGLALARTLVAADGGRLEMLSARPAIFAIFLPTVAPVLADPPGAPTAAGAPTAPSAPAAAADATETAPAIAVEPVVTGPIAAGSAVVAPLAADPVVAEHELADAQAIDEIAASSAASVSSGNTQRR
jgi:signal transduction histidine kinase